MAFSLLRKLRYGAPIVVVSGLPRSGTSMLMKMLDAGGVATVADGQRVADEDNPRGYFEDERVKKLAKDKDKSWVRAARGRAVKVISFLLKELPEDNNYKILFLRRDLKEILASQAKMLERRGEKNSVDDARMIELFEKDLAKVYKLLDESPHFEWLEVHYKQIVENPQPEARRIAEFLGGNLDAAKMSSVVEQSLYRNR